MIPTWLTKYLTPAELPALTEKISALEKQTSAEIVVVIQKRSTKTYQELFLWLLTIGLMFTMTFDGNLFFAGLIGLALVYSLQKKIAPLSVYNQAFRTYQELVAGRTRQHTGLLLFISLDEKQALLWGERSTALDPTDYEAALAALLKRLKQKELAIGISEVLEQLQPKLSRTCPPRESDFNELPNQIHFQEGV